MSFHNNLNEFAGLPVNDFDSPADWQGPGLSYRLRTGWDDSPRPTEAEGPEIEEQNPVHQRLRQLLDQPGVDQLSSLVIGLWSSEWGKDSYQINQRLIAAAPRLPNLRCLFLGDINFEECEVSWIEHVDVSPVLEAYPGLEVLRIRGAKGLSFSPLRHDRLRELALESGGLSADTLRELFLCEFPAVERLELFLGAVNYGFDGTAEDLQPLLSGRLYPKLKTLGLMNSEIADDLAAVVVNSPIVRRIERLDLSLGTLTDIGARALRNLPTDARLKTLDISHHYVHPEVLEELRRALPFEVIANDPQDPEDEWRGPVHAE